ncbi:MAG: alpha/beta hydrolase [Pseudomonadota bacterium]
MRSRSAQPWLSLTEAPRAGLDFASLLAVAPFLNFCLRGDGHPIVVMPGFLADDDSTWLLRQFLTRMGYVAHPWGQDRNLGATAMGGYEPLVNEVLRLHRHHAKKVTLIGWSLGGVHALAVAHRAEYAIRSVITLGSPLRPPREDGSDLSSIGRALQTAAGTINAKPIATPNNWRNVALKLSEKLPISSIYSKTDGVVPWPRSQLEAGPKRENIQVVSSHIGLGFNPTVYYALADRLAQPEETFSPFKPKGLARAWFPV